MAQMCWCHLNCRDRASTRDACCKANFDTMGAKEFWAKDWRPQHLPLHHVKKKKRVGDQTACCVAFFVCLNFPGKWLGLCVIKIYVPQMWINSIWKYLPLNLMHVYPLLYPYMIIYIRTTQIISNIKGCRRSVAGTALFFPKARGRKMP